jgi:hypothetical protein
MILCRQKLYNSKISSQFLDNIVFLVYLSNRFKLTSRRLKLTAPKLLYKPFSLLSVPLSFSLLKAIPWNSFLWL